MTSPGKNTHRADAKMSVQNEGEWGVSGWKAGKYQTDVEFGREISVEVLRGKNR